MAFSVNLACADQRFVNVCLIVLEGHSIRVRRLSLHTQAAMIRDVATSIRFRLRTNLQVQWKCPDCRTRVVCPSQPTF